MKTSYTPIAMARMFLFVVYFICSYKSLAYYGSNPSHSNHICLSVDNYLPESIEVPFFNGAVDLLDTSGFSLLIAELLSRGSADSCNSNCLAIEIDLDVDGLAILDAEDYFHFFDTSCLVDSIWFFQTPLTFTCQNIDSIYQYKLQVRDTMGNISVCQEELRINFNHRDTMVFWTDLFDAHLGVLNITESEWQIIEEQLIEPGDLFVHQDSQHVYVAAYNKIIKLDFDGNLLDTVVYNPDYRITGIDIDLTNNHIYFIEHDVDSIFRVNLDGGGLAQIGGLQYGGSANPYALRIDTLAGKLYWTDHILNDIWRCNLDGSNREKVLDFIGGGRPIDIALDLAAGKMYWTNNTQNKIQRSNLDGSQIEDIISGLTDGPVGLVLDRAQERIYFTDYDKIWVYDQNTMQLDTLLSDQRTALFLKLGFKQKECNTNPHAICQDTVTLYVDESCLATLAINAINGGSFDPDGDSLSYFLSPTKFGPGISQVDLLVSDGNLSDGCSSAIIVFDTIAPVVSGDSLSLYLDENGQVMALLDDLYISIADNCDLNPDTVYASQVLFDSTHLGTNQVMVYAIDSAGNIGSALTEVTILPQDQPNQPPIAICDTVLLNTDSFAMVSFMAEQLDGGSYDSDGDSLSFSYFPAGPFLIGTNVVFLVTFDGHLADTCEVILILVDTTEYPCQMDIEPPVSNCRDLILALDQSGMTSLNPEAFSEFFTDNCEVDSIWIVSGKTTFTCDDLDSAFTLTLMAEDPSNNTAGCSVNVTVSSGTYDHLLYWTDGIVVWEHKLSADLNDSIINSSLIIPIQLKYYREQNALFISDGRLILKTNLYGMVLDTIFEADTFSFRSFDLDPVHGDLYLLGIQTKAIHKVPLDGSGSSVVRVLDYLPNPIPLKIQCDPVSGLLYWTDSNDGKIRRCETDGNNLQVLVDFTIGEGKAYGLDLDLDNGVIYWTNSALNKIQRSDLNGNFRDDVVSGLTESPTNITLWDNELFWHSNETIRRAPVTGDSVVIVKDQLFEIYDIAIADRPQQGSANPCNQPPVAVCGNAALYVSQSCTASSSAAQLAVGSFDPDGDFLQYTLSSVGPYEVGVHQLSLYVSDGYLQDTCNFSLTVLDTTSPDITCRDTTLFLDSMGVAYLNPLDLLYSFLDNCDSMPDSLVISEQEFDTNDIGLKEVTLQVFDVYGNKSTCQSSVIIASQPVNQPPLAICDTLWLYVDAQCNTNMDFLDLGINSFDPDGDSVSITLYPTGPFLPGEHLIEVRVSDGLLADTCLSRLIVLDTLGPVITCYDTGFVMDQSFLLSLSPDDLPIFFEDNCDTPDSIILSQSFSIVMTSVLTLFWLPSFSMVYSSYLARCPSI
ncbi:MAG: hypothetical protein IPL46_21320 [Saprospiraceae bacterium]|nr:hypothetical protein [Saprospiraceae bacterium]